ncbi:MAG: glycyl-radical enzyme activating protein [Bacteroidetes bacterium]|nr:glycyl-radical enzyme activating protein [Bacteroidota bacterium]
MKGLIFDIKKFAVHDGPGIRTTLFLKGCPLSCVWCHNPEGIKNTINLWYFENKCITCRSCLDSCPAEALSEGTDGSPFIIIDRAKCTNCGICVEKCPTEALVFDSYELTIDETVRILLQDRAFYERSGGGITISGGDPLFQHRFSTEVLRVCRSKGVHTAIETSLQADPAILQEFIGVVDLFIVDVKIMDPVNHKRYIGRDNQLILSNFQYLAEKGENILVRIPLIPELTAFEENLREIGRFVHKTAPHVSIELINYNPLAVNKYRLLGLDTDFLQKMKPFNDEKLNEFSHILYEEGISVAGRE